MKNRIYDWTELPGPYDVVSEELKYDDLDEMIDAERRIEAKEAHVEKKN